MAIKHGVDRAGGGNAHIAAMRRTSSSRILRAPQCGLSRLVVTTSFSICSGSWLAYRNGRRDRSLNPSDHPR